MKVVLFSLLMFVSLVSSGQSEFPLQLMEPTDIKDIERLDYEVVRLNAKIRQCVAAGLAPVIECHCFYPDKLASVPFSGGAVRQAHPRTFIWEA